MYSDIVTEMSKMHTVHTARHGYENAFIFPLKTSVRNGYSDKTDDRQVINTTRTTQQNGIINNRRHNSD